MRTPDVHIIHREILDRDGEMIPAARAAVDWLGYPTNGAAWQAIKRERFPVRVIDHEHRRPRYWVRAIDVARYLVRIRRSAS
ncbi:MAG TPA: hypothetical protein VK979_09575 [Guyparkeria sp.]|nr:hypothetical protein [Guyparkeria sp.]